MSSPAGLPGIGTTAGYKAVLAWNKTIHGTSGPHAVWGRRCAELLDDHGIDAGLPVHPSMRVSTQVRRDETVRRIWMEANQHE